MSRVGKLTLSAVLSALGVLVLLLSGIVPGMVLPVAALAGLLPAVAVLHGGRGGVWWAAGCYAVTSALALLLLPDKAGAIWYLLFFGHYPIVKSLAERISNRLLCWVVKLAAFAVCGLALYFLFQTVFFAALPDQALWILFVALAVGFVLYDVAFSALLSFYCRRIAPHVDHSFQRR